MEEESCQGSVSLVKNNEINQQKNRAVKHAITMTFFVTYDHTLEVPHLVSSLLRVPPPYFYRIYLDFLSKQTKSQCIIRLFIVITVTFNWFHFNILFGGG